MSSLFKDPANMTEFNCVPIQTTIMYPTLKDMTKYPLMIDPQDNEVFDKMFKKLGAKYIILLRSLLKITYWQQDPEIELSFIR